MDEEAVCELHKWRAITREAACGSDGRGVITNATSSGNTTYTTTYTTTTTTAVITMGVGGARLRRPPSGPLHCLYVVLHTHVHQSRRPGPRTSLVARTHREASHRSKSARVHAAQVGGGGL